MYQPNSPASAVLNLTHLRTFVAVIQEGHVTRAAERLHISQPTASHHLRALEEQLGLPLFTRSFRGLTPTAAGARLAVGATKLLGASIELSSLASELRGSPSGRLVIGTIEDPPLHAKLPALLRWVRQHYPLVELSIEARISSSIRQGILSGEIDAGFFASNVVESDICGHEVGKREFLVVAPYEWQSRVEHLSPAELAELPWIVTPPGSAHSEFLALLFRSRKVDIRPVVEVSNERLLRKLVAEGLGIGVSRREFAEEGVARRLFCIVPGTTHATALQFAYARARRTDPLVQMVVAGLQEVLHGSSDLFPPTVTD